MLKTRLKALCSFLAYFGLGALLFLLKLTPTFASGKIGLSAEKFATENKPQLRLDFSYHAQSREKLGLFPKREFRFQSFYQTGTLGDKSLEPEQLVLRAGSEETYFWFGRSHPLEEGFFHEQKHTSAIGSQWLQNQSDALNPNVVGWIGAGAFLRSGDFFFQLAASPFYFPSFGPKSELSEHSEAKGARFARFPPQFVRVNNTLLPLRFRIDTGDIKEILLQPQGLFAVGFGQENFLRFSAWSSPTLNPDVDTSETLRIHPQDVDVLVTAKPKFPRENFLALSGKASSLFLQPQLEVLQETRTKRVVVSSSFEEAFLRFGALHTFERPKAQSSNGVESPLFSKKFVWAEIFTSWGSLEPKLRHERHLEEKQKGTFTKLSVDYKLTKNFTLFSGMNILTGQDKSYFGTWRSFDSLYIGAFYLW